MLQYISSAKFIMSTLYFLIEIFELTNLGSPNAWLKSPESSQGGYLFEIMLNMTEVATTTHVSALMLSLQITNLRSEELLLMINQRVT